MRRNMVGNWIEKLMSGDILAWSIAGFFILLVVVVLVFFIIDRRDKAKEKAGTKGKGAK